MQIRAAVRNCKRSIDIVGAVHTGTVGDDENARDDTIGALSRASALDETVAQPLLSGERCPPIVAQRG
jgi:hypothetical protein